MMIKRAIGVAGLLLGLSYSVHADIPGLVAQSRSDLDGYISYRLNGYLIENQSDSLEQTIQQRVNYEYRFNSEWRFNTGLRNRILQGGSVETAGYADWFGRDSGFVNLSTNWMEEDKAIANSQLDRLYLTWQQQEWLVRAGRSRINWGMTTIWNPNDIFNTYSIYETDYAERPGTDALLVSRSLDYASGIEGVFSPAQEEDLSRYALRYYFNHNAWDVQLIGGKSAYDQVAGVGFAGSLFDAGVRGEISYFDPLENTQLVTEKTTVSSLEADYLLDSARNWNFRAGLLHISKPYAASSSTGYLTQPLSARTLSFTQLTLYAEVGADLTELNRASLALIYYQDDSFYLSVTDSYSLAENWQLTASLQHFDGSSASLFGQTPTTSLFAMIRWDW